MSKPKHHPLPARNKAAESSDSAEPVVAQRTPRRLIPKTEVLRRVPLTFPTIWNRMRQEPPQFPRSRNIGGKTAWYEDEIDAWLDAVPESEFKKPDPEQVANAARARAGLAAKRKTRASLGG